MDKLKELLKKGASFIEYLEKFCESISNVKSSYRQAINSVLIGHVAKFKEELHTVNSLNELRQSSLTNYIYNFVYLVKELNIDDGLNKIDYDTIKSALLSHNNKIINILLYTDVVNLTEIWNVIELKQRKYIAVYLNIILTFAIDYIYPLLIKKKKKKFDYTEHEILSLLDEYKDVYYKQFYRIMSLREQVELLKKHAISILEQTPNNPYRNQKYVMIRELNIIIDIFMKNVKKYRELSNIMTGKNVDVTETIKTVKRESIIQDIINGIKKAVQSGQIDEFRLKNMAAILQQNDEIKSFVERIIDNFDPSKIE
jgi:hypothetical protein